MFVYKHFAYYYLVVQWSNDKFPFPNMDGQNCHLRCLLFSMLTNNRISKFQDWCKWVHLVNAIYRQLTDLSPRESISWWFLGEINGLQFVMLMNVLFLFGEDDNQDSSTKTETLEVIVFAPLVWSQQALKISGWTLEDINSTTIA